MFGKGKINRDSTPAESKFESNLSGKDKENYATMNHDNAVRGIGETTQKGWSVTQVGVTDPNWKG